MNISLPPGLQEFVREQVASGLYDSHSEVHRQALRLLKQQSDQARRAEELREAVNVGLEQAKRGEARACSADDIVALAMNRKIVRSDG